MKCLWRLLLTALLSGIIGMKALTEDKLAERGMIHMFPVIDKKATGVHMRRLMDERGLGVKDVQAYLGLGSVQSVYHWLNGVSMPTVDNLYALSELFDLPMDDMVRGSRETPVVREVCAFAYEAESREKRAA